MLTLTTDFLADTGNPQPHLRAIADAGFSHVHWCHHWNTDFLYGPAEIAQIGQWLADCRLELLDLHASAGQEKNFASVHEYQRQAGVALVANRLDMTARLGAETIVLHIPVCPAHDAATESSLEQVRKSLDQLQGVARRCNVRIALENLIYRGESNFPRLRQLLEEYPPDFLGLCYDSGHGNLIHHGPDELDSLKHRLLAVHLHDNDGTADLHHNPFTGTIDWPRLAGLLAASAYSHGPSLESNCRHGPDAAARRATFLPEAYAAARRLAELIHAATV